MLSSSRQGWTLTLYIKKTVIGWQPLCMLDEPNCLFLCWSALEGKSSIKYYEPWCLGHAFICLPLTVAASTLRFKRSTFTFEFTEQAWIMMMSNFSQVGYFALSLDKLNPTAWCCTTISQWVVSVAQSFGFEQNQECNTINLFKVHEIITIDRLFPSMGTDTFLSTI